jgi:hypothetical protein
MWLRSCGCLWQLDDVVSKAAAKGSIDILQWIQQVAPPWSEQTLALALRRAGLSTHVATVQWLIAQGAQWPEHFYTNAAGTCVLGCWSVPVVQ